jgi:predicted glycosyl hydrolase (DUF1957 family)
MKAKHFSLVLHSHIPHVLAHGSWPHGMDWLFEATAESYERARTLLDWLEEKGPLNPDHQKVLEIWEEEDHLFSEVVIPDGNII